ncbi:MAG: hypothetical protein QW175_01585 [Candidatus Bathyarchaeia archaeon]
MTKTAILSEKINKALDRRPGKLRGNVMLKKVLSGLVPNEYAAHCLVLGITVSAAKIFVIAYVT